jgi:two-component system, chemotaxis family, chemotaxis protein CheY
MKVLVLDDSKTMLRIISNTLKRVGHDDIVTAEDGLQGLEAFKEDDFDLILTDWNMPNMDGLAFVKEVRKINDEIPIAMITTEGGKSEVITALKAGVNNYIVKPFTPQILKEKLSDIMGV